MESFCPLDRRAGWNKLLLGVCGKRWCADTTKKPHENHRNHRLKSPKRPRVAPVAPVAIVVVDRRPCAG